MSAPVLTIGLALCACSSTGTRTGELEGEPARVRYADYAGGYELELVNESHTNRIELYSSTRRTASTKVTTDEVLEELIRYFEKHGFDNVAQNGSAPPGGRGLSKALEVEIKGETRFLATYDASPDGDKQVFNDCLRAFVPLYNQVYSLQTVENPEGRSFFDTPGRASAGSGQGY